MNINIYIFFLVPVGVPNSLDGEFIDSTGITVNWLVVETLKRKGPIRGYKIFCCSKDGKLIKEESVDETKFTIDFRNLEIYTFYQFKVLAFTKVGDGPKSDAKLIRTDSESMFYSFDTLSMVHLY